MNNISTGTFPPDQIPVIKDWNWWSDFLQREYYGNPDEGPAWENVARSLARQLDIGPGTDVLDLGSGCGEVVMRLAMMGARAVGVERSEPLVIHCARTAAERGVVAQFVAADMFTFQPQTMFDVVLSLNTSFGYGNHQQNGELLRNISRWLKPGGKLYLDTFTADNAESFGTWSDALAGGTFVVENSWEPERSVMISHPAWIAPDQETVYYANGPEVVRLYLRQELEQMMADAGLRPRRLQRAMGRRFRQDDTDMHTTWIAERQG
ncbi:MAG: methyltransferase domain-containing protein [Chlorobi bacterium]|nr:MAG: SAM-dependent methyltransferase [Chlorobi bacterium OLB7]MBK8911745.1 methyltransferase domain-containing protein [Chlorobiota bacterium]MBX7216512.1 methyltransferase domain-containing protein [Candidatus Kapabacteria bacterium]